MDERELVSVTLEYSDGTVVRPVKCAVFDFSEELASEEGFQLHCEMLNMGGRDLGQLCFGAIALGEKLGLFSGIREGDM